ncbi:MAG: T9SS type A sorting domain-containing protein [Breznakibacter sp.]
MRTLTQYIIFLTIILSGVTTTLKAQKNYYVATWGKSTNDGTTTKPWDLKTALSKTNIIKGGDTLFLESGTYEGHFDCRLSGSANNPVVIMPLKRDIDASPVIIDGKSGQADPDDPTFSIESASSYIIIKDLHFTSTFINRYSTYPNGDDLVWTSGISVGGKNCKIINCFMYDNLSNGIISGYVGTGNEFYGNIVFHNGCVTGSNNPRSHGAYIQNDNSSQRKTFENNILFNNYRTGIHAYSDGGKIVGVNVIGNIVFNNGMMRQSGMSDKNIIAGTGGGGCDAINVENNCTYNNPETQGTGIQAGYGGINNTTIVRNNKILNGLHPFYFSGWYKVEATNNKVAVNVQAAPMQIVLPEKSLGINFSDYTINSNEYYTSTPSTTSFIHQYNNASEFKVDFTRWQSDTGFDRNSTYTTSLPGSNWIEVKPNKYEQGRAHVAVYNFQNKTTETIDVSSFLPIGSEYVVYDVQNLFGQPLRQGTLTGRTIEVPLNNTAFKKPFGIVVNPNITHTPREFNVFLIRSRSVSKRIKAISVNPPLTLTTSTFTFDSPSAQTVTLSITNLDNVTVVPPRQINAKLGVNTTTVDITTLSAGQYYIVIQDAQTSDRLMITRGQDQVPDPPISIVSCTPSPVIDVLTIQFTAPKQQTVQIELFNSQGNRLSSESFEAQAETNTTTITMSTYPDAAYYVTVSNTASSDYCNFTKKTEPDIPFEMIECRPSAVDDILLVSFNLPETAPVAYAIKNQSSETSQSGTIQGEKGQNQIQINVATLQQGDYTIELTYNSQTINCSFVKNPSIPPPVEITTCQYYEVTESIELTIISQIEQTLTLQFYTSDGKKVLEPRTLDLKKGTNQHTSYLTGLAPADYYAVIDDHQRNPYCHFTKLPSPNPPTPIAITNCPTTPIEGTLTVTVNNPVSETIQIKIFDANGSQIYNQAMPVQAGNTIITSNVNSFVDGNYIFSASNSNSEDICEFTISRQPSNPLEILSCKPSPTTDVLFVNYFSPEAENLTLEVQNALNEKMIERTLNANQGINDYKLEVQSLIKGIYRTIIKNALEETSCEFEKANPTPLIIESCNYDETDFTILIIYSSPIEQTISIGLRNTAGQTAIIPQQTTAIKGTNQYQMDASGLAAGQYFVVLNDGYSDVNCETTITTPVPPLVPVEILSCGPSPVTDQLQVVFNIPIAETISYTISNQQGQVILEGTLASQVGNNTLNVSMTEVQEGSYYAAIYTSTSHEVCDFIIDRDTELLLEIKKCTPTQTFDWVFTQFFSPRNEDIELQIIDAQQAIIISRTVTAQIGLNDIQTNVSEINNGNYILRINNNINASTCNFEKITNPNQAISIVDCPSEDVLNEVSMTIYSPVSQTATIRLFDTNGLEVANPTQLNLIKGDNRIGPLNVSLLTKGAYYLVVKGTNLVYCNFNKIEPEPTQTIKILSCSPSITMSHIEIAYNLFKNSDVTLKIYDYLGTQTRELLNKNIPEGDQTLVVNLSDLTDGQYYLVLFDNQSSDFCSVFLKKEGVSKLEMTNCSPKRATETVLAEYLSPIAQALQLTVSNDTNQEVYSQTIQAEEGYNQHAITVGNWEVGNYTIEISNGSENAICTFFKQNEEPSRPLEVLYCINENEMHLQTSIYSPIRQEVDISIYAQDGTPVLPRVSATLEQGTNIRSTNISMLRQGVYYYVVSNATTITYCKFGKSFNPDAPILEVTLCTPNPTLKETFINYYISEDGMVSLKLINANEEILEDTDIQAIAGQNRISIDFEGYPLGIYFAVLQYKESLTFCEINYVDYIKPEEKVSINNCFPKVASDLLFVELTSPLAEEATIRFRNADEILEPYDFKIDLIPGLQRIAVPLSKNMPNGVFELILSTQSSSDNCTFTKENGRGNSKLTLSRFYPNPTTNLVNIEYFSFTNEDVWIEVYENSSRQLIKNKIPTKVGINMTKIDLSALSPGLYIIVVRQGNEQETFKQLIINQP